MNATELRRALRAEWTKFRSDSTHGWLLLALALVTAAVGAAVAAGVRCDTPGCTGQDPVRLALGGVTVGQVPAAVLGVLVLGNEYGSGLIRTTLTALPRRGTVMLAKALVLAGTVTVAAAPAVLASLLAAAHWLPLRLTDGQTLRAAAGSVLYLALVALLALGVTAALRSAAASTGVVLGLLYLFPVLARMAADPQLRRHLQQLAPMPAGLAVQATRGLSDLPIAPWAGLGVLTLWALASLTTGAALLRWRDA